MAQPGRAAPAGGVALLAVGAAGLLALCFWLAGLSTPLDSTLR